jgi:hypothetical protein
MATARPVGSVRRSGGPTGRPEPAADIPPARWAGVALVIAALLATIFLAVVSPGVEKTPGVAAQVSPAASQAAATFDPADPRVPSTRPTITAPRDRSIESEWYVTVTVNVPQEPLPSKVLSLVILKDGEEVKRLERPGRGKSVDVPDVPLATGTNVLTATLVGPGGRPGPESSPIVVHQDRDAPKLAVVSPESGTETYEDEVDIEISSEPGAALVVTNNATKRDSDYTVGPTGSQTVSVRLAVGRNRINVTSTDDGGMTQDTTVMVVRKDTEPVVKLSGTKQVKRSELPARLRFVVEVKDSGGDAVADANVSFTLGGSGWPAQESVDTTDDDGRAVWTTELPASPSKDAPRVTIEVVTPQGGRGEDFQEIKLN